MAKFNSESGSEAGKKSRRGSEATVTIIRNALTGKMDIDELFEEIGQMELNDRVNSKIKLLSFVLPKLQAIDLNATGELTVSQFISLNSNDQDLYLEKLINGKD